MLYPHIMTCVPAPHHANLASRTGGRVSASKIGLFAITYYSSWSLHIPERRLAPNIFVVQLTLFSAVSCEPDDVAGASTPGEVPHVFQKCMIHHIDQSPSLESTARPCIDIHTASFTAFPDVSFCLSFSFYPRVVPFNSLC